MEARRKTETLDTCLLNAKPIKRKGRDLTLERREKGIYMHFLDHKHGTWTQKVKGDTKRIWGKENGKK